MSQVNLLPPEVLQSLKTKRTTGLILLGGLVVVALILAFYLLQVGSLGSVNDEISAQEQTNQTIQSDIDGLQKFADLQTKAQEQQALLATAYQNEVSFSGMLMDLSRITPTDSFLNSFSAQITGIDPTAPATTPVPLVGTMQLGGEAIGYDTIATWLSRLEQVRGWVNPWVPSVSSVEGVADDQSFTASVDLTADTLTARGRGEAQGG